MITSAAPNFDSDLIRANVPAALRERAQWIVWKSLRRGGKLTKVPFNTRTGGAADTTDPSTWSTFEQALSACAGNSRYAGVGYVFAADDPYSGVDLDDCVDPLTAQIKTWGREIIDELDSYSETSPSLSGVKVIVQASKPGPRCRRKYEDGEVEIYSQDRFFALTGRMLEGGNPAVAARQAQLESVYAKVFGEAGGANQNDAKAVVAVPEAAQTPVGGDCGKGDTDDADTHGAAAPDDERIIRIISRSRSGTKFKALWAGNWQSSFGSRSEADSALVFLLAFYTKDAAQLDRLFRRSGLIRDKWDEKHGAKTYGAMTIDKALEKVTAQYQPRRPKQGSAAVNNGDVGAADDAQGLIPLGQRDPQTGRLVLSPKKTLPTAAAFIDQFQSHQAARTLHSYAGTLLAWRGNRFVEIEEESLRQRMQPWLHDALRYQYNKQTQGMELVGFESNPGTVKAAVESLRAFAHLPVSVTPPCWLDGRGDSPDPAGRPDPAVRPDPRNLLAFPSGTLDLSSGRTLSPTAALFNINAIDFEYDPNPFPPLRWLDFLSQLWGDDRESIELLQEWMGYCLVADTGQQKMLLMVGPKRSGKGTIGRVLARLVGAGNVVGPTTSSLAGPFGLQPLIGKSLAIVSDARFGGENIGVVVERLLCISGEDTLTVDRKFLGSVTMKLAVRFIFLTNELPRMNDASGALAGRFVILRLTRSFYGQEDTALTGQLMGELPGILLWAIEGLRRLRARGHFVQPQAVREAVQEMEDLASPVLAFVRDCCEVGPSRRTWVDEMYQGWKRWCESDGRNTITSKQVFGRDLSAAVPGVICRRHSVQGRFYDGIALRGGEVP
jgi:putative DNA primase/helicase